MLVKHVRAIISGTKSALLEPTGKQKEASGRWLHTLSAASVIGAVTIMFAKSSSSGFWYDMLKVAGLGAWGFVLFIIGSVLSKGE